MEVDSAQLASLEEAPPRFPIPAVRKFEANVPKTEEILTLFVVLHQKNVDELPIDMRQGKYE